MFLKLGYLSSKYLPDSRANICFKSIKFPRGNYQPIVPQQKHSIVWLDYKSGFSIRFFHRSHNTSYSVNPKSFYIRMVSTPGFNLSWDNAYVKFLGGKRDVLWDRDFYRVIVDEGEAWINYRAVEIESE